MEKNLKKYIIVINDNINPDEILKFTKIINGNYINTKGGDNLFLIITDEDVTAKDIFFKLAEKNLSKIAYLVIEFNSWYGNLPNEAFDWLDEKFPKSKLIRDSK